MLMTRKYVFFPPHPAVSHVVNNIIVAHVITPDSQAKLSFHFPPLPEHSILFYPYDKPVAKMQIQKRFIHYMPALLVGN